MTRQPDADRRPARDLSRRQFLTRSAALAATLTGLGSAHLTTRIAYAATPDYTGDVLIIVSLRGGFDGLSAVAPIGDPEYRNARPTLAVPDTLALPTGTRQWGLHPALAPLHPWWTAGTFGAIHAVGTPNPTRSHFSATADMERAAPGTAARTGWIDRALGLREAAGPFQGAHVGSTHTPQALTGPFRDLSVTTIERLTINGAWGDTPAQLAADEQRWTDALTAVHQRMPDLAPAATAALDAVSTARALTRSGYTPANGATYPHTVDGPHHGSVLSAALHDTARLIRARVGVQLVCIDYGDWDTHSGQGTAGTGRFHSKLSEWAASTAAFLTDLGPAGMQHVTVLTMSEFGRRVAENGDHGTDHGHGNAILALGGGVAGGTVHGTWPGLTDLDDGDLRGTTDYRDVLAEALTRRCQQPAADLPSVFPGKPRFTPPGLFIAKT